MATTKAVVAGVTVYTLTSALGKITTIKPIPSGRIEVSDGSSSIHLNQGSAGDLAAVLSQFVSTGNLV